MHRIPGILLLTLAACSGGSSADRATTDTMMVVTTAAPAMDPVLRIILTADPRVYANGHAVPLAGLDSLLAALKDVNGEVWLYREATDPASAGRQDSLADSVLGEIARHELTIRVSRRPDFSDRTQKPRPRPDRP
jgi:hypothetical protein